MLEDPSYSSVVRWGDDGESFVVLENEKFTKHILPKHFKHSNFASFVRQLNKYDFHKVRQSNEEGATSIYGPNAWEFKHPEFKANNKDSLDNIRRKAPAPRKAPTLNEEQIPIQQIDLMNQQIAAQAQQIETLNARFLQAQAEHQMVVHELIKMHKMVVNHEAVMQDVMTFLHAVDAKQRRDSKAMFAPDSNQTGATLTPTSQSMQNTEDEPASPLQHASKLLHEMNADQYNISTLEQIQHNSIPSPTSADPNYRPGTTRAPTAGPTSNGMIYTKLNGELDSVVYPTGTTQGIDPMYADHHIPYPIAARELDVSEVRRQYADSRKKSNQPDPGWSRAPRILLVEDDPTCRQIGGKFLYSFACVIDTALDGLEAVSKVQEGSKYDLILMDIIMPNLDGVSACHIIRQFDRTPIVAMTSNIRSDDIQMYFQHGMDDVLPKPFTRKSLLEMLEKHLMHLKKLPTGMDPPPQSAISGHSAAHSSATQSVRDDFSAANSPAGSTGTWNSPSQYSGVSPINPAGGQFGTIPQPQFVDTNGNPTYNPTTPLGARGPGLAPQPHQQHRRNASDMSGGAQDAGSANKRQRVYPPPATAAQMAGRQ